MGRHRTIALATAAALATVCSSATAKGISTVSLCGSDGCRAVADERLLPLLADAGLPHRAPHARAEHFVARVSSGDGGSEVYHFELMVVPAAGLVRSEDGTWGELSDAGRDAYLKLTRDRVPLPASAMPAAAVAARQPARASAPAPAAASAQPARDVVPGGGSSGLPWPWLAAAIAVAAALTGGAMRRARTIARRPTGGPANF